MQMCGSLIADSPGPAAYPADHALVGRKKHQKVPKTIYPADQAHMYSLRIRGREFTIGKNPGILRSQYYSSMLHSCFTSKLRSSGVSV